MADDPKTLTVEELMQQLSEKDAQIAALTSEKQKAMAAQSKASSEAAAMKDKLKSYMSEEEQKKAERDAEYEQMKEQIAQLNKEKTIRTYQDSYLAMKYSPEHAKQAAEAMAEGDMDKVMSVTQAHNDELFKTLQEAALLGTPKPPAGTPPKSNPDEMSDEEYYAALKAGKL